MRYGYVALKYFPARLDYKPYTRVTWLGWNKPTNWEKFKIWFQGYYKIKRIKR